MSERPAFRRAQSRRAACAVGAKVGPSADSVLSDDSESQIRSALLPVDSVAGIGSVAESRAANINQSCSPRFSNIPLAKGAKGPL